MQKEIKPILDMSFKSNNTTLPDIRISKAKLPISKQCKDSTQPGNKSYVETVKINNETNIGKKLPQLQKNHNWKKY